MWYQLGKGGIVAQELSWFTEPPPSAVAASPLGRSLGFRVQGSEFGVSLSVLSYQLSVLSVTENRAKDITPVHSMIFRLNLILVRLTAVSEYF